MKYEFFKDELGTIWYRDCFVVEAETYEEACEKAKEMIQNDEIYDVEYCEPVYETWSPINVNKNDNFSTLELLDAENNKIIWKNGE